MIKMIDENTVVKDEIQIGSLGGDKNDPTRIGVVCVGAFRINQGPGAWVLWPGEAYEWAALTDIEPATASIGA